jgi:2-octaprenyl-6-methoxyphenol hydroxylase
MARPDPEMLGLAPMKKADIVIAGGNLTGLSLAIALKQGLGESFSVAVADPSLGSRPRRAACSRRSARGTRSPTARSRSSTWW